MARASAGFTLMEMVLVLALIVIVAGLSVPAFQGMIAEQHLSESEDLIRGRLATARSRAIKDGIAYRVGFQWGQPHFRIAPDSDEYWGGGSPSTPESDETPPLIQTSSLPGGICFNGPGESSHAGNGGGKDDNADSVSPSDFIKAIVYFPNGTAQCFMKDGSTPDYLEIAFRSGLENGQVLTLKIRSLTGTITSRWTE